MQILEKCFPPKGVRQHVALTNCHDRNWLCHPASCPVPAWLLAVCFAFYPSLLRERALGVSTACLPGPPGAQVKSTEPCMLMLELPEVLPACATAKKTRTRVVLPAHALLGGTCHRCLVNSSARRCNTSLLVTELLTVGALKGLCASQPAALRKTNTLSCIQYSAASCKQTVVILSREGKEKSRAQPSVPFQGSSGQQLPKHCAAII